MIKKLPAFLAAWAGLVATGQAGPTASNWLPAASHGSPTIDTCLWVHEHDESTSSLDVGPATSDAVAGRSRTDELERVLRQVRSAIGYERIAVAAKHFTIRSRSRDAGGYESVVTTTFSSDGRFLQHVRGPEERITGFDGTTAWRILWGVETVLSLGERESALTGTWIRTGYWLDPDAPLTLNLEPGDEVTAPVRLGLVLEGGLLSWVIEINRRTWLPECATVHRMGTAVVVRLEDYVDYDGWKAPRKVSVSARDKVIHESVTESVVEARSFAEGHYNPRLQPPKDTRFDPSASPKLEVKRSLFGGRLLVHPLINGKDVGWFLFDTGAGGWTITREAARKAGIEIVGQSSSSGAAGLSVTMDTCRARSLQLGPAIFTDQIMRAVDLAESGSERVGLIGHGLLARCVVEYDDPGGGIWIYDPQRYELEGASWQDLVAGERVPTIEATFEGRTALFRVDTGSNSSVVFNSPYVERLGLLEGRATYPIEALGGDGRLTVQRGKIDWFELGGQRFTSVDAEFATIRRGVLADPYTAGIICNDLLKPFRLVLDCPHNRIAFVAKTARP